MSSSISQRKMDHSYGIAVTNKFSLFLDEDEDPLEIISRTEEQSKTKKDEGVKKPAKPKQKKIAPTDESKPKPQEPPIQKKEEKPVSNRQNERGRGGSRSKEPREIRDNFGEKRPPRRQGPRENKGFGDENTPPEFKERTEGGFRRREDRPDRGDRSERPERDGFGDRGRGRGGRGRSRGRGFGRGGGFGQRREFDRHSSSDKTEQTQPTNPADESGEWSTPPEAPVENTEIVENGETTQPTEEEVQAQEMTLDEWKALQSQSRQKPEFNIRRPGEGVDNSKWTGGVEYNKKHDSSDGEYEEGSEEDHHGKSKHLVTDIRITFNDNPRRGRGRRGGRGAGGMERGGFGRGSSRPGPRGDRKAPREVAPRFDDESDFPSLK